MFDCWLWRAALHSLGANSFIILRWVVKLLVYINSGYYRPLPWGDHWLTPDTPYFEQLQLYNLAQDSSPPELESGAVDEMLYFQPAVSLVAIFSLHSCIDCVGQVGPGGVWPGSVWVGACCGGVGWQD